jgi:hypothetical protein
MAHENKKVLSKNKTLDTDEILFKYKRACELNITDNKSKRESAALFSELASLNYVPADIKRKSLLSLGVIAEEDSNYVEAESLYKKALSIGEIAALGAVAKLYETGKLKRVESVFEIDHLYEQDIKQARDFSKRVELIKIKADLDQILNNNSSHHTEPNIKHKIKNTPSKTSKESRTI